MTVQFVKECVELKLCLIVTTYVDIMNVHNPYKAATPCLGGSVQLVPLVSE